MLPVTVVRRLVTVKGLPVTVAVCSVAQFKLKSDGVTVVTVLSVYHGVKS